MKDKVGGDEVDDSETVGRPVPLFRREISRARSKEFGQSETIGLEEKEAQRGILGDNWVLDLGDFLPFTKREKYRR